MKVEKVAVFCASSTKIDEIYLESAYNLGRLLADQKITLVYGGGGAGSMGKLANGALEANGKVIGYIPEFMVELEWAHKGITTLEIVNTMTERKNKIYSNCDAIVVLPGGTGTLEELTEIISLKKLGLFTKPIIIVNINGFYDYLLKFLKRTIEDNFMGKVHAKIWSVVDSEDEVLEAINGAEPWSKDAMKFAAI